MNERKRTLSVIVKSCENSLQQQQQLSNVLKEGWVLKKSETLKRWNRRFLVIKEQDGEHHLVWGESKYSAVFLGLSSPSSVWVLDASAAVKTYKRGDRRKIELSRRRNKIYLDSIESEQASADIDVHGWYETIGKILREKKIHADTTLIQADLELQKAIDTYKESVETMELLTNGRGWRAASTTSATDLSPDLIYAHKSTSLAPVIRCLERAAFVRFKRDDFKTASSLRFTAALLHFSEGRVSESIQSMRDALSMWSSDDDTGRSLTLKRVKELEELEISLCPLSIDMAVPTLGHTKKDAFHVPDDWLSTSARMLTSEGFSSLAFLNVADMKRDISTAEPRLIRLGDTPASFDAFVEAQTASSKIHFLGDLVPLLPENVPEIVRDIASERRNVHSISGSIIAALELVAEGVEMYNRRARCVFVTSLRSGRSESTFRRLDETLEHLTRDIDSLGLCMWPRQMRRLLFVEIARLMQFVRANRALVRVQWSVAAYQNGREVDWWRLIRMSQFAMGKCPVRDGYKASSNGDKSHDGRKCDGIHRWRLGADSRVSVEFLMSSQQISIESILDTAKSALRKILFECEIARQALDAVLQSSGLEIHFIVAVPKFVRAMDSRRKFLQELTLRLQKAMLLVKDIAQVAFLNLSLFEKIRGKKKTPSGLASSSSQGAKRDSGPLSLEMVDSAPKVAIEKLDSGTMHMVDTYGLERDAGIPSLHLPAHQLQLFHDIWKRLFRFDRESVAPTTERDGNENSSDDKNDSSSSKVTSPRDRVDDCVVARARDLIAKSDPKQITYNSIKWKLVGEFGEDAFATFRDVIKREIKQIACRTGPGVCGVSVDNRVRGIAAANGDGRMFHAVSFADFLLLYPYKSSADIQLVMQTRPVLSEHLQEMRLLFGVSRSIVTYWTSDDDRAPFRVDIIARTKNEKTISGKSAGVLSWATSGSERTFGHGHRHKAGDVVDTEEMETFSSGEGTAMIVFRNDLTKPAIIIHSHIRDRFHHSSVFAGRWVSFAGEISVRNGAIQWISNKSGHYRPGLSSIHTMLRYMASKGIRLESFPFDVVGSSAKDVENIVLACGGSVESVVRRSLHQKMRYARFRASELLKALDLRSAKRKTDEAGASVATTVLMPAVATKNSLNNRRSDEEDDSKTRNRFRNLATPDRRRHLRSANLDNEALQKLLPTSPLPVVGTSGNNENTKRRGRVGSVQAAARRSASRRSSVSPGAETQA